MIVPTPRKQYEIDAAIETLEEVIELGRALKLSLDLLVELAVAREVLCWAKGTEQGAHFETLLCELLAHTSRLRRREMARLN